MMDSKIAGTPEVKADIRLRFKTANQRKIIATKISTVSTTSKGISFKSVEQKLTTKDENGEETSLNQRCADIQKQIPNLLGMSKSIL